MREPAVLLALALTLLTACDAGGGGTAADATVITLDGATDEGDGAELDVGQPDGPLPDGPLPDGPLPDGPLPDAAPPPPSAYCEANGLPVEPWRDEAGGLLFGDTVGDFTAQTLDGPFTLSERWSGCESYVFLVHFPDLRRGGSGPWFGDKLWDSDPLGLIAEGGRNVHYLFVSFEPDPAARVRVIEAMKNRIEVGLALNADPDDAAHFRPRFHFVTDRLTEVEGSVGAWAGDYLEYMFDPESFEDLGDRGRAQAPLPFTFAVDRGQRWDAMDSLNEVVGAPMSWAMAGYASHYYDYHASLRARLAETEDETTEVVLLDELVTDRVFVRTVELPADLSEADTLEVDVAVDCRKRNTYGCSEWDRIARVSWCADAECAERREIVRWITPYWRRGLRRWVIDATPFLGLMRAGGAQHFHIEMGPAWERATERHARIALRLASRGGPRSEGVTHVFGGGGFGAAYNDREPVRVAIPAEATRVELVSILSGHGQTDGDNCAEWCDHRHQFAVNGHELPELRPDDVVGTLRGCALRVVDGVPPGQGGNWAPGRAYWCPGLPVDAVRVDVTEHVTPGEEAELTYRGNFRGMEPRGGDIALNAYLVWYD